MNDKDILNKVTQNAAIISVCKDMIEAKNRDNRRLFIALVISICLNILVFIGFIVYESQFETVTDYKVNTHTEVQQDTKGNNSDIINGNQYNGDK